MIGKYDEAGNWVLPSTNELTPAMIALVIAARLSRFFTTDTIERASPGSKRRKRNSTMPRANFPRAAHYCSGCPHNTSTAVPEGSRALGGIGCHYMVTWMDRRTDTFTQMGGEGATWCGQAPFTETKHVFQNLGDGTYFHSGSLAIRQAIAAKVNITYKILYNDAVAMTGGQPVDGTLTVPDIAHQVRSEGVHTIVVDERRHREVVEARNVPATMSSSSTRRVRRGVEAHARGRRRQRDDLRPDLRDREAAPAQARQARRPEEARVHQFAGLRRLRRLRREVVLRLGAAEGNRIRAQARDRPVELQQGLFLRQGLLSEFRHDQGRRAEEAQAGSGKVDFSTLPQPQFATDLAQPWNILVTGIGGTGVVTIGALIGMAAHLEGKGGTVLDQTGLAQKGGAVTCHLRIARTPADIHAVRIAAGEADLVLGCDMVVVNDYWALSKIRADRSHVVLNTYEAMPGTFTTQPDMQFPALQIVDAVKTALDGEQPELVDATDLATKLLGDSIASNLFMLGYAWQKGWVPVSLAALMRAVELNGAAIEMNKTAFSWGRLAAVDIAKVKEAARGTATVAHDSADPDQHGRRSDGRREASARTLDEEIARRVAFLADYQDAAYAAKYKGLVDKVRAAEQAKVAGLRPR